MKTILITGSTDGIGYQAAIELAKSGHEIIVHGRNKEKAKVALNKIIKASKNSNLNYVHADLSSIDQIKQMVKDIKADYDKLDVLINNAGLYRSKRTQTPEGLELTFAVNYVAPFLLTNLLLDLLEVTKNSRIVNVASRVQSNELDFKNLQLEKNYTGVRAYAKSKTALILFTYYLAEKLKKTGITVNCLHPGVINTKLLRSAFGVGGASLSEGANTLLYAATSPDIEHVSGKYFVNNRATSSKEITYDKEIQEKLWHKTEALLDMRFFLKE